MDLILNTIGLPSCDNALKARRIIKEAIQKDRHVQANIDEVAKLAADMVYSDEE